MTTLTVQLYSEAFAVSELKGPFMARPSRDIWNRWQMTIHGAHRIFIRITHPLTQETFHCSVGDPIQSDVKNAIYLPSWMIHTNKYEGCGEDVLVEVITPSDIPRVTRIVLKPEDPLFLQLDVIRCLEEPLSSIGILQQGKTYLIPIKEMDDYIIPITVEVLEPANVVFLDGDEVPLEFVDIAPPRPPTPIPSAPPVLLDEKTFLENMIPDLPRMISDPALRNTVHTRAETNTNAPALTRPIPTLMPPVQAVKGFVPFQGQGRRLNET